MFVIITTSWSWSEFPFDWKMQFLALQGRGESFLKHSFPISSVWFGGYYLRLNSSPVSAGSDIKFKRVHTSFIHHALISLLQARTVPDPLHIVFQVLTTLKGTVGVPISVWNWGEGWVIYPRSHGDQRGSCLVCLIWAPTLSLPALCHRALNYHLTSIFDAAWISIWCP